MSGSTSRDISRHYPSGWSKRNAKDNRLKKTQLTILKFKKFRNILLSKEMLEIPVGQKTKNTQQLLKLMKKLCSKRRKLLRKKMLVPLFSFFQMTLVCGRKD